MESYIEKMKDKLAIDYWKGTWNKIFLGSTRADTRPTNQVKII